MVIHDRLVPQAILELARREATILEVGKTAFGPSWKQDDINALIVAHARAGATVVRLKGGDPAVFGRLDEEIEALRGGGHRLCRGAGHHLGQRRRRGDRPVADQARAQLLACAF